MTLERYDDARLDTVDAIEDKAADAEQLTGDDAEAADEIRAEIAQTRINMGGTLNELGDRLEPGNLVNQAKENVYDATVGRVEETAKGMSDMVIETIKRNPIPAAIAGAGLAMLWANRDKGSKGQQASGYNQSGYRYVAGGDQGGPDLGAKARDAASTVGDAASTVGQNVSGAVGNVAEGAGQAVGEVGFRLDSFMKASPIAVAAIAAGAGAALGAVLPETKQEQQVLGDVSRQIGTTVRDTVDEAADKAEKTLDKTEEKIASGV